MPKCKTCGVGSGEVIGQCHDCWMLPHFVVTPCLLGFEVRMRQGHGERVIGILDFGKVLDLLFRNWKLDYTIELR